MSNLCCFFNEVFFTFLILFIHRSIPEPDPKHTLEEQAVRWKLKILDVNQNEVCYPNFFYIINFVCQV